MDRLGAGSTTCSSPASHSPRGAHLSVRKHGAAPRGAGTTCLRATARLSPAGRLGAYLSHLRTETWRLPARAPAHRAPSACTGPRLPLFRTKTWRRPTRGGRLLAKVLPPPSRRLRSGHTGRYPPEPGSEDRPQRGEGCSLGRAEAEASRARRASLRASTAAPAAVSFPARAAGGRTPRQVREGDAEPGSPAGPAREAPGGIPRHFFAPSAPVGSRAVGWRRGRSRGGGRGRRRAAFCPAPRGRDPSAPLFHRPQPARHSLAGPNSCLQRNPGAQSEWHWGPEGAGPGVGGRSAFPLPRDPFCWGVSCGALGRACSSDGRSFGPVRGASYPGSLFGRSRSW